MSTIDRLYVYLSDLRAGAIERGSNGRLSFTYDSEYLAGRLATPLSPALPLGTKTYGPRRTEPFVEGLLPERSEIRARWARKFETTASAFDLLSHMGLDCAGAVQFSPLPDPIQVAQSASHAPIDQRQIGARLTQLRTDEASWNAPEENWSLAGAQSKFALAQLDGRWHEAHGAAATTHIIKPGISSMTNQAMVEHVTMLAARNLGLLTAATSADEFDGNFALVVTRFDRVTDRGQVTRVHQVDLCQSLNRRPENKYETERGPTAQDITDLLRRVSSDAETDLVRFCDAVMFNYVAACPDGHSKNYSLLMRGSSARLAPIYDVATGLVYDHAEMDLRTVAMSIGGRRELGQVDAEGWRLHAKRMGLKPDLVFDRLEAQLGGVVEAFESALTSVDQLRGHHELKDRLLPRLSAHVSDTALKAGFGRWV